MAYPPLGMQTLIFSGHYDAATQTDLMLERISASGYTAFEGGASNAERFIGPMAKYGLKYGGAHVTLPVLGDIPTLVDFLSAVDCRDLCNSGLLTWDNPVAEDYHKAAELLNVAGLALRSEGIHLHYHNHAFEFKPLVDGGNGMDILLAELDPGAVDLCVDVAWVQKAGLNAAEFLTSHSDWVGYLHLKDYSPSIEGEGWTELGRGDVDLPGVMAVLPSLPNVRWVMVEQDTTTGDPVNSIAISRHYLWDTFVY